MRKHPHRCLITGCDTQRHGSEFFCAHHQDMLPRRYRNKLENAFTRHQAKRTAQSRRNMLRIISQCTRYVRGFETPPKTLLARISAALGRILAQIRRLTPIHKTQRVKP